MERITMIDAPQGMMQLLLNVEAFIGKSGIDNKLLELLRTRASGISISKLCSYKEIIG